jgi:hypothetical protein
MIMNMDIGMGTEIDTVMDMDGVNTDLDWDTNVDMD